MGVLLGGAGGDGEAALDGGGDGAALDAGGCGEADGGESDVIGAGVARSACAT